MTNPDQRVPIAAAGSQRKTLMLGALIAAPLGAALWLGLYYALPPPAGMDTPWSRLGFAIKCACVAVLLCFFLGIEAVSHERLHTRAIDPLAGAESPRMKVNLRYLQHTLEQLLLFVPGLLALAFYCTDGRSMRAVLATTAVWIVFRFVFWIGYHRGPQFRAPGLIGMIQSALVLLYVCTRFGYELAGVAGAAIMLVLFAGGEVFLVWINRHAVA